MRSSDDGAVLARTRRVLGAARSEVDAEVEVEAVGGWGDAADVAAAYL